MKTRLTAQCHQNGHGTSIATELLCARPIVRVVTDYNRMPVSVQRRAFAAIALAAIAAGLAPCAPASAAAPGRSISEWVSCTGTDDDTSGAIQAFAAARNNAFTLIVDCPVRLHSGLAIDRGIFIDNGTTVQFTGRGKFFVDNMFHPAFVIANSSEITLTDWIVEWDGEVPVNPDFGGYELAGRFVASAGQTQPAAAFNDLVLSAWLTANRSIKFDETQGWVKSVWVGGVNPAAVFFITGDSTNLVVSGLRLSVPSTAGANAFMPMAFSLSPNWNSDQTVNAKTPSTSQHQSVPQWITFSNISLDGILMGWQGTLRNSTFEAINSARYGDLQDASGRNVGGIGKWFPPPHLFYLNYDTGGDEALFNSNLHFTGVLDAGPRLGVARDTGGGDPQSGYAASLKLGCWNCSVDNYGSLRPDGFMDVLPSKNLSVSNVFASFDSGFLNNLYPAGIRFPGSGYTYVTFQKMTLQDTASSTTESPLGNASSPTNSGLVFSKVEVDMTRWAGDDLPLPTLAGATNSAALTLEMSAQSLQVSYLLNGTISSTLQTSPMTVHPNAMTALAWASKGASACTATGAWSGAVGTNGSRAVRVGPAGNYDFGLTCVNSAGSSTSSLLVVAK